MYDIIKSIMTRQKTILGIDEAGRGPVIGPMVVAGVLMVEDASAMLRKLGVKDSKQLTPVARQRLAKEIRRRATAIKVIVISPEQLDARNLNTLTADAAVQLIKTLKPDAAFIDAPVSGSAIVKYEQGIKAASQQPTLQVSAQNKADVRVPIVSAASIIAKVERDKLMARVNRKYRLLGLVGSGYPADPATKQFLITYYTRRGRWPKEVRTSWQTLTPIELLLRDGRQPTGLGFVSQFLSRQRWAFGFLLIALVGALFYTQAQLPKTAALQAALIATSPAAIEEIALVTKVIDGDTVTIQGGRRVRLLGIDTPEVGEPCYAEAKQRLQELVLSKTVKLVPDAANADKYGRLLRFIFLNNQNINLTLIQEGLAVAYFFDDRLYKQEIQAAEAEAIKNRVGCRWHNVP